MKRDGLNQFLIVMPSNRPVLERSEARDEPLTPLERQALAKLRFNARALVRASVVWRNSNPKTKASNREAIRLLRCVWKVEASLAVLESQDLHDGLTDTGIGKRRKPDRRSNTGRR